MKTVILFGSPRKDGNTHVLVDAFARRLREKQHEVSVLYLGDLNICPCRGCLSCLEKGECAIDDDMEQVSRHIREAEVVVYATPIYWFAPSAQLKLVMDRSIAFLDGDYSSRVRGKKAVTLITCADASHDTCQPALDIFRKTFELLGMTYAGHVEAVGCADKGKVGSEMLQAAKRVAESVLV
jgi:multimeric flavodoxin WrbA